VSDDDEAWAREQLEAALDRDDPTLHRLWRHKIRGNTVGSVVGDVPKARKHVILHLPDDEFTTLKIAAVERGLRPIAFVRQCVATSLVEEHGIAPSQIPWLSRDGLLP